MQMGIAEFKNKIEDLGKHFNWHITHDTLAEYYDALFKFSDDAVIDAFKKSKTTFKKFPNLQELSQILQANRLNQPAIEKPRKWCSSCDGIGQVWLTNVEDPKCTGRWILCPSPFCEAKQNLPQHLRSYASTPPAKGKFKSKLELANEFVLSNPENPFVQIYNSIVEKSKAGKIDQQKEYSRFLPGA